MPLTQLDPHAALVLVDLQKGIAGLPTAHDMQGVVGRAASLARTFRSHGLPVVLVNVDGATPGRVTRRRTAPSFPEGWVELLPALEAQQGDIRITKQRPGAFLCTDLHEQLQQREVTQVFLAGVSTSMGVESTARSAFDLGYHVVFVEDAITDLSMETHRFYVENVFPREGEVEGSDGVLAALSELPLI